MLITTPYVDTQAYKEIREDRHPILIVCGRDIVAVQKRAGFRDRNAVTAWLSTSFAKPTERRGDGWPDRNALFSSIQVLSGLPSQSYWESYCRFSQRLGRLDDTNPLMFTRW